MKKLLSAAVSLVCVLLGLTGCVATLVDTSAKEDYQKAVGTPEDSVVFFGYIAGNTSQSFSQMNPDFPPDYQHMNRSCFVSKPVAPGSTYVLEHTAGDCPAGNIHWYWAEYFSLQSAVAPLFINVPKKPGLYYVGDYDGLKLVRKNTAENKDSSHYGSTMEQWCLKAALELYKDTAWEEAFTKRLEEIEAEKKSK